MAPYFHILVQLVLCDDILVIHETILRFIFYALNETARYMSGLPMTCRAEFTNIKSTQRQDLPKSIMLLYSFTLKNFYQWTRLFIEKSALKSGIVHGS